mmetsp:Transcript_434/g.976  ORF Transcript_434/g.976 Transcript_434/m.976 type:complete len:110 (+) Transcript_434:349-678(+)
MAVMKLAKEEGMKTFMTLSLPLTTMKHFHNLTYQVMIMMGKNLMRKCPTNLNSPRVQDYLILHVPRTAAAEEFELLSSRLDRKLYRAVRAERKSVRQLMCTSLNKRTRG